MPDIGTMHQLNPEPPHIGTMHQLGPEPLHTGEIITPQAQAEEYAREAQESANNAALSAAAAQSAAETAQQAAESIAPALDEKADAIHTAAGPAPIVSIPDAAAAPVDALTVGIEPVQSGSGDPSPENVRPITGWTGAKVTRTGKNLFDKSKAVFYSNVARFIKYGVDVYADTLPNGDCVLDVGTYTLSISGDGTEVPTSMSVFDSSGNRIALIYNNKILTFTTTSTGAYYLAVNFADAVTWADYNIQLELGSTATAYTPYSGSTYAITFPSEAGTVYGGTLTVNEDGTGQLVVDRAEVDLGSLEWAYDSTSYEHAFFYATPEPEKAQNYNLICSRYANRGNKKNNIGDCEIGVYNSNTSGFKRIIVRDDSFSDVASFKTAMSGVQLVYEIATPVTYQLTPQQAIKTLLGQNNIWADTGDVTVGYKADTKMYIDTKFAELQALILEN